MSSTAEKGAVGQRSLSNCGCMWEIFILLNTRKSGCNCPSLNTGFMSLHMVSFLHFAVEAFQMNVGPLRSFIHQTQQHMKNSGK